MNGKVKEAFKEWAMINLISNSDNPYSFYHWHCIPKSMQWGVLQEFYNWCGVGIDSIYMNQFLFFKEGEPPMTMIRARECALSIAEGLLEQIIQDNEKI